MEPITSNALCEELELMMMVGPGGHYKSAARIRKIKFAFASHENPRVRIAANEAVHWVAIWCSPRRWQQWNHEQLRRITLSSVVMLRRTVASAEDTAGR